MSKFKTVILFIMFITMLLTAGCRQRIIKSSENPDNYLPLEELASDYEESVTEYITEMQTIPETTTKYEEPTTETVTTAPETASTTTEEPTTEPVTTQTSEIPDATQKALNEIISTQPVVYNVDVYDIEIVEESQEPVQIPDVNNENNEKFEDNAGNSDADEKEEQHQNEIPPEISDNSEDIITVEEIPEERSETVLSDDGIGTIGIIVDQYAEFLNTSLITLYDCQKYYVYYESINEYQTINRASAEHKLIAEASGYNVGEKLKDDALTVSGEWIMRKNPSMIIKCVGSDVLGTGVTDKINAKFTAEDITSRPDWERMGAVINRNIILISEELLSSEDGRLLAKLYIASSMYPELFTGVEISEFCLKIKEAGGNDYENGIFFYSFSNG